MTRDDIIRMAREAGGSDMEPYDYGAKPDRMILFYDELVILAYKIAAAEREACAKVCEEADIVEFEHCMVLHQDAAKTLTNAAAAIRARGSKE